MRTVLSVSWQYVRAFIVIYLCLYAGMGISYLLPLTIPGSIIGMLILFALLASQILPVTWVAPGCQLMIRYMALLFVPISVGVMDQADLLMSQFGPIVVSCVISTLLVLLIVGYSSHRIHRKRVIGEASDD